jgi:tRNA(His) 5'-end guanylyltransferase
MISRAQMGDALGDRMKGYEARESERRFLPMVPVCARIDGRGFSGFTRGMDRPYDLAMQELMVATTCILVEETHARIGYTQSDEISLVWQSERSDSSIFFDHRVSKLTSVLAALATVTFCRLLQFTIHSERIRLSPHFDCRVWQVPNRTEAANVFLWREQDATKNAISMATRSVYSHKEMDHKSGPEMQEMLFARGINFNDYPAAFKRGSWVRRETAFRELSGEELARIPEQHRPTGPVERSSVVRLEMPRFGSVTNREAVIFDGAKPEIVP